MRQRKSLGIGKGRGNQLMILLAVTFMEKEEDKEFILELYDKYHKLIYKKICDKTGTAEDAEDLVNDTFIKLIGKMETLKALGERELLYYIVQTSSHVAIDHIKRNLVRRKHVYYGKDKDLYDEIAAVEDKNFTYDERLEDLADAILKLPEKDSGLLIDKYFFNKTDQEIADSIGVGEDSVRQLLTRARRRARAIMEKGMEENEN